MADEIGILRERTLDGDCYRVRIEAPKTAAAYTVAGQYCTVAAAGQSSFFAVARAPGATGDTLEFAIKAGGNAADALIAAALGTEVRIGPPAGRGYPIEAAIEANVELVFIGTGSGAAALNAPIEVAVAAKRKVTLFQGHRGNAPVETAGCQVFTCLSRPAKDWTGPTGHVQDLVEAEAPDWRNAWLFVCGQKVLLERVAELGKRFGLPEGRISTNY